MKPDKLLIEAFLRGYNKYFDATYRVTARPDELERRQKAVDALARDAAGRSLGIEHTLIQPFAGQKDDDQKFSAAVSRIEQNQGLRVPGYWIQISVPVGAIPKGIDWKAVLRAVEGWLRRTLVSLPEGRSKQKVPDLEFSWEVIISKKKAPRETEGVFVARHGAPNDFVEVVRSGLKKKLPKLADAEADQRILLLELDSVVEGPWDLASEIEKLAPKFLDLMQAVEVWCAQTSQAVGEGNVHFSRLRPGPDPESGQWVQFCESNAVRVKTRIRIPQDDLTTFCRKHHIRKLSFFGSVLRDDFSPQSDVDVLVEFEPGRTPGLEFFGIEDELSGILGHRVDLNTPQFLSRHFRNDALAEAEVQYLAP